MIRTAGSLDVVVLAGTHEDPRHLIHGRNKAFLAVGGEPSLLRVLRMARAARSVGRIAVVGPMAELRELENSGIEFRAVDEGHNLVENAWAGFLATLDPQDLVPWPPRERPDVPMLRPGRPRPDFHELYGQLAGEMADQQTRSLPLHRWEWIVREYRYYLGRVGYRYPPDFERRATERMLADRDVIHLHEGHLSFASLQLQEQYARFHRLMSKAVLFLSGDVPLAIPEVLDDFVARSYPLDKDFYLGLSTEESLAPYRGGPAGRPGIERPYMHLYEYKVRLANLNIVKPNRVGRIDLLMNAFAMRKMKEWGNVLRLSLMLARLPGRVHMIKLLAYAQAAAVLARHGLERRNMFFRRRLRLDDLSSTASRVMLTDFMFITTPFGGVSLDIDTAQDLEVVQANLELWLGYQHEIACRLGYRGHRPGLAAGENGPAELPPPGAAQAS